MWTKEMLQFLEDNYLILTSTKIAKKLKVSRTAVHDRIKKQGLDKKYQIEYAVYQGDKFLFTGTKDECIKKLGIEPNTFRVFLHAGRTNRGLLQIINIGRWEREGETEPIPTIQKTTWTHTERVFDKAWYL